MSQVTNEINHSIILGFLGIGISSFVVGIFFLAMMAKFAFKIKISISSLIASSTLSLIIFTLLIVNSPVENQKYFEYFIGFSISAYAISFMLFMKLFEPKDLHKIIEKEIKKSSSTDDISFYKEFIKKHEEITQTRAK